MRVSVLFATRAWESPPVEGGFVFLRDLAKRVARESGGDVRCLFFSTGNRQTAGIEFVRVYSRPGWARAQRFQFLRGLMRQLRNVDVVHFAHTPTFFNALVMRLLKLLHPRVHFVQTITGFHRRGPRAKFLFWGDRVLCISRALRDHLHKRYGIDAGFLYPRPDESRLQDRTAMPDNVKQALHGRKVVCFPIDFYRLDNRKFDLGTLVSELTRRCDDVRIVIFDRFHGGKPYSHVQHAYQPGDAEPISRLFTHLPDGTCLVLGREPFLLDVIANANVVAFPITDVEGKFNPPLVLIEALALNRMIVCSNRIDLGDYEQITYLGDDSAAWTNAICRLLEQEPETGTSWKEAAPPDIELPEFYLGLTGSNRSVDESR